MSPKQCRKGPSGAPPLATIAILSVPLATLHRWLHSLLPRAPGKAPGRRVGGCAGAQVQSGSLPRQAPCRGRRLVVFGSLSLTGPWRDARRVATSFLDMPWLAFPASSSCRGFVSFPASSSCRSLGLSTLFLNGSKGTTEDLGGHPASLAAGCCDCPCTSSGY